MSLYTFSRLEKFLDQKGYPQSSTRSFQVIQRNLVQGLLQGDIIIRSGGIFHTIDGKEYKGYIFNEKPDISTYGVPKFHAAECSVVANRGSLHGNYIFATSEEVQLYDRGKNGNPYPNSGKLTVLELCNNCRKIISKNNQITTTKEFHAMLIEEYGLPSENESTEVDFFGYPPNWSVISRRIRESRSYICERCNIDLSAANDRRFLHVHHLNGRKTDVRSQNLQCLCVRCHSQVDQKHESNFSTYNKKPLLDEFNKRFKS